MERFPWHKVKVEQMAALRADLAGRLAPNTANKILAAVRGVLKASWRMGRLTARGWEVVDRDIPVRFIRRRGMRSLPVPRHGGQLSDLRGLVNLPGEHQWILAVAWLVAAFRPGRPFTVLSRKHYLQVPPEMFDVAAGLKDNSALHLALQHCHAQGRTGPQTQKARKRRAPKDAA